MKQFIFLKLDENLTFERYIEISNNLTQINKEDIGFELTEHASIYSYYNGILNHYKFELDKIQITMDKLEADIRSKETMVYRVSNNSKPTDKHLEACVNTSVDFNELKQDRIKLEYKYNLIRGLLHSLDAKKDCIVQLSSNSRAEMKLCS